MSKHALETGISADHLLSAVLPDAFPVGTVRLIPELTAPEVAHGFQPQTDLGHGLWKIRKQAIANGMKLLNQDEVLAIVRHRRGEND
ncbi:MAG: hypothetical protein H7839_06555 [Magnetococcus sp. YQC-5]